MSSMLNEAINEKHNEGAMVNALAGMIVSSADRMTGKLSTVMH